MIESKNTDCSSELLCDKWQIMDTIGKGSFASVKKAKNTTSGKIVALKVIPIPTSNTGDYHCKVMSIYNFLFSNE